jgi:undecaprenyl-diphosphatase
MTAFVRQPTDLVVAHPSVAGLVILVSAASEAIVVVCVVIPGTSILLGIAPPAVAAGRLVLHAWPSGYAVDVATAVPTTAPPSRSTGWSSASRSLPSPPCPPPRSPPRAQGLVPATRPAPRHPFLGSPGEPSRVVQSSQSRRHRLMTYDMLAALILGALEGFTEFLPVSSTGHLILAGDLLGFQSEFGKLFEIVIQLGAILAVMVFSFPRLWKVLVGLPNDPGAGRFASAIILAFLPAAVLGALFHNVIKTVLFSPEVVVTTLVLGGITILVVERLAPRPRYGEIETLPMNIALGIGFCQTVAMIPGVSRAGATILGGELLGVDRRVATEFSFYLAIPTMLGATVFDLWKTRGTLTASGIVLIVIGFVTAFVVAIPVVRGLIGFVGRHGLVPFAWYRIVLGLGWAAWVFYIR